MKNRRGFLTALTAASGAVVAFPVAAKARAQAAPSAHHSPTAASLAIAATFRRFDPKLSETELATIARNIDESRSSATSLNPKATPLRNSDDLVVRFVADERF